LEVRVFRRAAVGSRRVDADFEHRLLRIGSPFAFGRMQRGVLVEAVGAAHEVDDLGLLDAVLLHQSVEELLRV
jgi:hypothetical protein